MAWAQTAPAPSEAPASSAATTAPGPKNKTLFDILIKGGPATWICVLLSVVVTGFAIDGFVKFRIKFLCPPTQLSTLQEQIQQRSYQDAWQFCQDHSSFLCTVVKSGLERIGRGSDAVEHSLEEVSTQQAVLLRTSMNYLSVIGVVAPMIGLTGTVLGMIRAFESLGASGIGDPSALASAIGEVLTSTASGLAVAIPGFVFFYVFKSKAQTAVMLTDAAIYRLFENIPYKYLTDTLVGEGAKGWSGPYPLAGLPQDAPTG